MIKKVLFLALLIVSISCSESEIDLIDLQARVIDVRNQTGLESCEWLLDVGGTLYKASYLPPDFLENNLLVRLKVELLTGEANCGTVNNSIRRLRIEQISKVN